MNYEKYKLSSKTPARVVVNVLFERARELRDEGVSHVNIHKEIVENYGDIISYGNWCRFYKREEKERERKSFREFERKFNLMPAALAMMERRIADVLVNQGEILKELKELNNKK